MSVSQSPCSDWSGTGTMYCTFTFLGCAPPGASSRHDSPLLFYTPVLTPSHISLGLSEADTRTSLFFPNLLTIIKVWPPTAMEPSSLPFSSMHQLYIAEISVCNFSLLYCKDCISWHSSVTLDLLYEYFFFLYSLSLFILSSHAILHLLHPQQTLPGSARVKMAVFHFSSKWL